MEKAQVAPLTGAAILFICRRSQGFPRAFRQNNALTIGAIRKRVSRPH